MNPKIKKDWIAALRSGDYVQGRGRLRQTDCGETRFCCLGVLCNLHAYANPEYAATQISPRVYGGSECAPPLCVLEWAGLSRSKYIEIDGYVASQVEHLWKRNDGMWRYHEHSFHEMADFIEENF